MHEALGQRLTRLTSEQSTLSAQMSQFGNDAKHHSNRFRDKTGIIPVSPGQLTSAYASAETR